MAIGISSNQVKTEKIILASGCFKRVSSFDLARSYLSHDLATRLSDPYLYPMFSFQIFLSGLEVFVSLIWTGPYRGIYTHKTLHSQHINAPCVPGRFTRSGANSINFFHLETYLQPRPMYAKHKKIFGMNFGTMFHTYLFGQIVSLLFGTLLQFSHKYSVGSQ